MDQIGVGECQTHQVLWWQARIRKCVRDVEDNGGRLESQHIHPALLQGIREGKVGTLHLDEASGQVYCRQRYQQASRQWPPPPQTPLQQLHQQQRQQRSASSIAAGFGNVYVPGQAPQFPQSFHSGAEGGAHGAGSSGGFRVGMGGYGHGNGISNNGNANGNTNANANANANANPNANGNGGRVPMPQARKELYIDTHGYPRVDANPPADGATPSPQNATLNNFGGGNGGGGGWGPETPVQHSPLPPAAAGERRGGVSQHHGLNPNATYDATHYREIPAQPRPRQHPAGRQHGLQDQARHPWQGPGECFGEVAPQAPTTAVPRWAASATPVTPLPAQMAQMDRVNRGADAKIQEQLQPAVVASRHGAAAIQSPPDPHVVGGHSKGPRPSTTPSTPLAARVGSTDEGRASPPPPQQQERSKTLTPLKDVPRTEAHTAAKPKAPPLQQQQQQQQQQQERSKKPHPQDVPHTESDTRWPAVLRDALNGTQQKQRQQVEGQPDQPRPVDQGTSDPSSSSQQHHQHQHQHQQPHQKQKQKQSLVREGEGAGGAVGRPGSSGGVGVDVRLPPLPEEEEQHQDEDKDEDHHLRQDTDPTKGDRVSGRLVLPPANARISHRQSAAAQPQTAGLKAALANSKPESRKLESRDSEFLRKLEPVKPEAGGRAGAGAGAGTYAEATSGRKRATTGADGASSRATTGSQPETTLGGIKMTVLSIFRKRAKKTEARGQGEGEREGEGEGEGEGGASSSVAKSPITATVAPTAVSPVPVTPTAERIDTAAPPSPSAEPGWGSSAAGRKREGNSGDDDDDVGSGSDSGISPTLGVSTSAFAPREANRAQTAALTSAADGEREIQDGDGDGGGGSSGGGVRAGRPTLDVSATAFTPREASSAQAAVLASGSDGERENQDSKDGGAGIRAGGSSLDVSASAFIPQEANSAQAAALASAADGGREGQDGHGEGGRSGGGVRAGGPTLDVSAAAFTPQEATGPASQTARKSPRTELFEAAKAAVEETSATPPSSTGNALFQAVRAATANDAAIAAAAAATATGRSPSDSAAPARSTSGAAVIAPPARPSAAASALYKAAADAVRASPAPPAPSGALYEAVLEAATGRIETVRVRTPEADEDAQLRADPDHLRAWFQYYRSSSVTSSAPPPSTQHQPPPPAAVATPSTPTVAVPPSAGIDIRVGADTDAPSASSSSSSANLSGRSALAAVSGPTVSVPSTRTRVTVPTTSDDSVAPVHGSIGRSPAALDDAGSFGVGPLPGILRGPAGDNDSINDDDNTNRDTAPQADESINLIISGSAEPIPQHPDPAPVDARAAGSGDDRAVDPDTVPADYVLVHDKHSFADGVVALGTEKSTGSGQGGGTGRLGKALRGAGAVGVRLGGRNLGAEDGVITTIQIAGGTGPTVLILDVIALLETAEGSDILNKELRSLLEDVEIHKVMHDAHDHAAALARFLDLLDPQRATPGTAIKPLLDLELAYESLGGGALNSFGDALWSLGLRQGQDYPRNVFSMAEEILGSGVRPLPTDLLQLAAHGAASLQQSFKLVEDRLVVPPSASSAPSPGQHQLDIVLQASQIKADYATRSRRNGWRRMTFVDVLVDVDVDGYRGGGKTKTTTLVSFELHEAMKLWTRLRRRRIPTNRDGDDGDGGEATGRNTDLIAPEVTMNTTTTSTGKLTSMAAAPNNRTRTTPSNSATPPKSAKQEIAAAANKSLPAPAGTSGKKRDEKETEGEGEAATSAGRQGEEEVKVEASSSSQLPSSLQGATAGTPTSDEPTDGTEGTPRPTAAATVTGTAMKLPPGVGKATGGGVEEAKISFGDLGNGFSVGGGVGNDVPAVPPQVAGSGVSQGDRCGGTRSDRTRRRERNSGVDVDADEDGDGDTDVLEMLKHLPKLFLKDILAHRDVIRGLEEIVLDQGRRPRALVKGRGRVYMRKDPSVVVTRYHINCVVGKLEHLGLLAINNAAGFDGLLHRVGVMRDQGGTICGVTIRVGRYFKGMADIVDDVLLNATPVAPGGEGRRGRSRLSSILVLGGQGVGKTSLIRDMCRKLSPSESVVVVDTRNEIGGEGVIPHRRAIGEETRRLMVPPNADQHELIVQAYRHHSPQTLVVDEISSQLDVDACLAAKARGVRLVAGAVGDLPSVLDCHQLGKALGGLEDVPSSWSSGGNDNSIGNDSASDGQDKKERRAGQPVFDAVIEVKKTDAGEEEARQPVTVTVTVVKDVGGVVDELLATGAVCHPEIRKRVPLAEDDDAGEDEDGDEYHVVDEAERDDVEDDGGARGGPWCQSSRRTAFLQKVIRDPSDRWLW